MRLAGSLYPPSPLPVCPLAPPPFSQKWRKCQIQVLRSQEKVSFPWNSDYLIKWCNHDVIMTSAKYFDAFLLVVTHGVLLYTIVYVFLKIWRVVGRNFILSWWNVVVHWTYFDKKFDVELLIAERLGINVVAFISVMW